MAPPHSGYSGSARTAFWRQQRLVRLLAVHRVGDAVHDDVQIQLDADDHRRLADLSAPRAAGTDPTRRADPTRPTDPAEMQSAFDNAPIAMAIVTPLGAIATCNLEVTRFGGHPDLGRSA